MGHIMATSTTKRKTKSAKPTSSKTTASTAPKAPAKMVEKPAAKPAVKSAAIPATKPKLVTVSDPVVSAPDLKKKELIDLVVERSSIKKKDAKPVIEAMLAVLGETIASGRELNLQPLGKLRINRATDKGNGRVIICKLRQSTATKSDRQVPVGPTPD